MLELTRPYISRIMSNSLSPIIVFMILWVPSENLAQEMNPMKDSLFLYHLVLTPEYNDPEKWNEETLNLIQQHGNFLNDLGKKGILSFAGRTLFEPGEEGLFGIALIKASSMEQAREIMAPDPAVVHGIQQAQLFPFSLGIRYLDNL